MKQHSEHISIGAERIPRKVNVLKDLSPVCLRMIHV